MDRRSYFRGRFDRSLNAWGLTLCIFIVFAIALPLSGTNSPSVDPKVSKAIASYLLAPPAREKALLRKALKALDGDLAAATAALRTMPALFRKRAGTYHGQPFESGGRQWEYSIHLPKKYNGRHRFPVLVLPDHSAVGPEAGINFWKGKRGAEDYILFRPVIVKYQTDRSRFPAQPLLRDQAIAAVMRDALRHLRLHYAVDHDRFTMTGLSQAGYYTYYYAVSFPEEFAAIIPESAGGGAVDQGIRPLAASLAALQTRILHTEGDQITPYRSAEGMRDAIEAAGGKVELITYTAKDYPGQPPEKFHPGPHNLRLRNVLPWAKEQRRKLPTGFTRVLRHPLQQDAGQFLVEGSLKKPISVEVSAEAGELQGKGARLVYLVPPEVILEGGELKIKRKTVTPKADLQLMLRRFKAVPDPQRLAAAQVKIR